MHKVFCFVVRSQDVNLRLIIDIVTTLIKVSTTDSSEITKPGRDELIRIFYVITM